MWLIFLLIVITPIFIYLKNYKRRYDISMKIPGPPSWPFLGYTKLLNATPESLFTILAELQNQYKGLYKLWLFTSFVAITNDPELVEKILNNQNFFKSSDYELLKPWLGTSILTSEGKRWFSRRKAITPAFHFKILEDFLKIFEKHTNILVSKLRTDDIVDVTALLPLYTLDNICETAMGIDINAQSDTDSSYVKAVHSVSDITYKRMFNPLLAYDFIFRLTKEYPIYRDSLKIINSKTQNVIELRRSCLEDEIETKETDDLGRKKKMAFLDILLKTTIDGEPLSHIDIEEEVNTLMFAGHDTTSTACGFLLYDLARHSEIQLKLLEEIWEVFGKDDSTEITISALNDLRYLDMVVKESIRMHTTIPFIGRQILEETEINGILFPENTNMSLNVYGMCHNEDLFLNPEKFEPERFDATATGKMNPYAFIPFSAGPRNCIGQKFAMFQIKMMAVKVLKNFAVSLARPDEELILGVGITLKAINGIHLKFKERV